MREFFTLLIFSCSLWVQAKDIVVSEQDLHSFVERQNRLVGASRSKVKSLNAKVGYLGRSFVPEASLAAGQESFQYVSDDFQTQPFYGAQLKMNLYNGGRDSYEEDIRKAKLEKGKSLLKVNLFTQLEEARKTFWSALYLREVLNQYEQSLGLIKKNKQDALKRIRGGVATQSDRFEFDIKEVEIDQDRKRVQFNFDKQVTHLKVLLGVKQTEVLKLKGELSHEHNWRQLIRHTEEAHNYLVKPYEVDVVQSELEANKAKAAWRPKLDAYALWLQNNQRNDFDRVSRKDREQTALGIRATWRFSDFIEGRAEGLSKKALAKAQKMKLEFQKQELESELHMEIKELELLDSMVHVAEDNIKRSEKFFRLIRGEYKRGVKTSGDMLAATDKLVASKIRRMEIIRDFKMAKAHIMTKLGE